MPDWVLDFLVALFPIAISVIGVWTFEPLSRRKVAWRAGLIVAAVTLTALTLIQQARQRTKSAAETRGLKEQILREAELGDERAKALTENSEALIRETPPKKASAPTVVPQKPSADKIAAAVEQRLRGNPPATPTMPTAVPEKPLVAARPSAAPTGVAPS